MKYNFDEFIVRIGTDSEKWESGGHGSVAVKDDSLAFSIADMDFACAPQILDAIRARLDKKIIGYTKMLTPRYLDAVCGWFARRFDFAVNPAQVQVYHGVMGGIQQCLRRLMRFGEGLIIQQPVYSPFMHCGRSVGAKLAINKLVENNGQWEIDFDDLEKLAAEENNKVMLFCSPHNPVGRVWTETELLKVGEICRKHGVVLVSDEIHCDLIRKDVTHTPAAKVIKDLDIITCTSVSKSFNLPGLEIANLFFNSKELFARAGTPHQGEFGNPLSIEGSIAAYNLAEDWLDELNIYIDANFKFVKEWLSSHLPKVKFSIPEGTYLAWFDVKAHTTDSMTFAQNCAENQSIILEPGEVFGEGGTGFIRFNCAAPRALLQQGLERFKEGLTNCR